MRAWLAIGASLLLGANAFGQDRYEIPAEQAETARMLQEQALESDLAWDIVESLTTEIGPRLGGSEAEARARRGLAHVRTVQGRYGDAIQLLMQADDQLAQEGDPFVRAGVMHMLGELEAERGRSARAVDAWRKAVSADRAFGRTLLPKIEAGFAARKKVQEYEKFVRSLLEERPEDASAHVALARSLAARGETVEAIESLSRAVEIAPGAPSLRVELGRLLLDGGQEGEALKAFGALLDVIERDAWGPLDLSESEEGTA